MLVTKLMKREYYIKIIVFNFLYLKTKDLIFELYSVKEDFFFHFIKILKNFRKNINR